MKRKLCLVLSTLLALNSVPILTWADVSKDIDEVVAKEKVIEEDFEENIENDIENDIENEETLDFTSKEYIVEKTNDLNVFDEDSENELESELDKQAIVQLVCDVYKIELEDGQGESDFELPKTVEASFLNGEKQDIAVSWKITENAGVFRVYTAVVSDDFEVTDDLKMPEIIVTGFISGDFIEEEPEEIDTPATIASGDWIYPDWAIGGGIQFDSSTGSITDASSSITSVNIPSTIDGVTVTSIGGSAFRDCSSLTNITIPSSVTSIGDYAFNCCSSLTNITIPSSVIFIGTSAFSFCSSLTNITIPSSGTSIGSLAFYYCSSLTNITIPSSVAFIGSYAFSYCSSLTNITIPSSVAFIGDYAFDYCISLTDVYYNGSEEEWEKMYIGINNSYLTNATIHYNSSMPDSDSDLDPDIENDMANWIFVGSGENDKIKFDKSTGTITEANKNIVTANIPSTINDIDVNIIGSTAFMDCSNLVSMSIAKNVTSIENSAFSGCSSLDLISIPSTMKTIKQDAFSGCSGLNTVYYTGDSETWQKITIESGNDYLKNAELILAPITGGDPDDDNSFEFSITDEEAELLRYTGTASNVVIPMEYTEFGKIYPVTSIAAVAFTDCSSLTTLTIPNSILHIGAYAFYDCDNLETVYFDGVEAEWNALKANIHSSGNYNLTNANIIWNDLLIETLNDFEFYYFADGTINITGYKGKDQFIDLTKSFDGKVISVIGNSAFYCNDTIISIIMPNTVVTIESGAFYGCTSLLSLNMSSYMNDIGDHAFNGCTNLTKIWYTKSEEDWKKISGINEISSDVTIEYNYPNRNDFIYLNSDDAVDFLSFLTGKKESSKDLADVDIYKLMIGEYRNSPDHEREVAAKFLISVRSFIGRVLDESSDVLDKQKNTCAYRLLVSKYDGSYTNEFNEIYGVYKDLEEIVDLFKSVGESGSSVQPSPDEYKDIAIAITALCMYIGTVNFAENLGKFQYFSAYDKYNCLPTEENKWIVLGYEATLGLDKSTIAELRKWADFLHGLDSSIENYYNRETEIKCPVEVNVIVNGVNIANLENSQAATMFSSNINMYVTENEDGNFSKTIQYHSDDSLSFVVNGLETGTMDYAYTEISEDGSEVTYSLKDIEITQNSVLTTNSSSPTTLSIDRDGDTLVDDELTTSVAHRILFDRKDNSGIIDSMVTDQGKLKSLLSLSRDHFVFLGWFEQEKGGTKVTLDKVYTSQATLYAQWEIDESNPPPTTSHIITFDAQSGTSVPSQTTVAPTIYFSDTAGHWAENSINYVVANKLFYGTSDSEFSPNSSMTRGMFVTVVGRLADLDASGYQNSKFDDVESSEYYTPYVSWAVESGFINGMSDTEFAPNTDITREQMAVILYNYAKTINLELPTIKDKVEFTDNSSMSSWAVEAVYAMQQAGVLNGKNDNAFDPTGNATRGEVAVMLRSFMNLF